MRIIRTLRPFLFAFVAVAVFWFATGRPQMTGVFSASQQAAKIEKLNLREASGPTNYDPEEQVNISVYKKVLPSVVNITSTAVAFDFFYGVVPQEGLGSGFVIDSSGLILTNYHVIANARQLEVKLADRKHYKAVVVGADPSHDIAVIRINAPNLAPATLGDSKKLEVGQKVFAIGNPFGLSGTMTRGIISSIRSIRGPDNTPIDDAIQTDAAINPGNSGGPLLNSRGEVIGINTQIATGGANQNAGIGFAVPINTAKAILNDLVTEGKVRRPNLGIRGLGINAELADEMKLPSSTGVLIVSVTKGGVADNAGLRGGTERAYIGNYPIMLGGDLIVAIDGQDVADMGEINGIMNNHRSGDTVNITIYRNGKKIEMKVILSEARETA